LDVGSGSGESLLEIQKMGARAFGVEPDPNAQRIAKQLKLRVYKGFITGNPFLGKKFDFVTASQVFEHEPEPLDFLRSAKEKLNNKGQIILSVPNLDSIYRKVFGRKWLNWHVPYHINFFTKLSLKKVAKKTGLKIVEIRTITPNVWTLMQFRTLLYNVNEGQKNPIWTSATSRGYKRGSVSRVRDYIFQFATMIFYVLITPINRLVDLLGGGDSLFVVLENAQ
jgi:SAM-dependent methyltransferase